MADSVLKWVPFLGRSRRPGRSRAPGQVTALDVDGQTLRVAQASQRRNQVRITRIAAVPVELPADGGRSDPAVVGAAIAEALSRMDLKPGAVVMGVSRAQVVLRTLTLPPVEDVRELASMVHFQLARDLPFRMEDAVIDFKVGRESTAPVPRPVAAGPVDPKADTASAVRLEVLVAAVKRETVEFYEQTARAAGLKLVALGLLSYANARGLDACHIAEGDQAVALVSLRPDEMSIEVIAEQTLLFSRGASLKPQGEPAAPGTMTTASAPGESGGEGTPGVPGAPPEPTWPETFASTVTIEVVRSLHSYTGMAPLHPVAHVAVTGATGHEEAVVGALEKRLNIPVRLLDLTTALSLPEAAREQATAAISPIGLALGVSEPSGLPFDFLNPKRPARPRNLRRIRILVGASAAALVFVLTLAARSHLINQRETIRRQVAADLAEAEKQGPLFRRMIREVAGVNEWMRGGRSWLEHYGLLSALLPPGDELYVTSLAVSGPSAIRMNVQARNGEVLAKLEKQLRGAGYEVKPIAITPGTDRHGYEFRSSVELVLPEKMTVDLVKNRPPARPEDDASLDPTVRKGGRR